MKLDAAFWIGHALIGLGSGVLSVALGGVVALGLWLMGLGLSVLMASQSLRLPSDQSGRGQRAVREEPRIDGPDR
jgi:hypothetical protein